MNASPCGLCMNFDPIYVGGKLKRHGRCAVKSHYPAQEGPGQLFPPGVRRVEPGQLAKPHIVAKDEVVSACGQFRANK